MTRDQDEPVAVLTVGALDEPEALAGYDEAQDLDGPVLLGTAPVQEAYHAIGEPT